jgi:hypothetical protein
VRDFIEWGFRTGMLKGEISQLDWSMFDRPNSASGAAPCAP